MNSGIVTAQDASREHQKSQAQTHVIPTQAKTLKCHSVRVNNLLCRHPTVVVRCGERLLIIDDKLCDVITFGIARVRLEHYGPLCNTGRFASSSDSV
ncbi:hypothetical protein J6590_057708 [Homalodisca vitripennis]|nr:hypothetical protein J6590_057708 [Homalodisca vitripennis]